MAMPAMKKAPGKVMKSKARKAKRVSKVATGRMAKVLVMRGAKEKTSGGLKKDALMKNRNGKIVSKRKSAQGKKNFAKIEQWVQCIAEAREKLHLTGFSAINGKTTAGKALYAKTKALYTALRAS
mmetsp:Transcript_47122/g.84864  ORF Transcript_47122/g.84864 Transcript_47122/m.84864 type:complete len:125 (+) Transcript_47122:54-428(+)|eukprot:CAMPEP_0197657192 /NCGR_PEP_ID=MMETSP1338-20131121/44477_1 /TAXON_ID=43686 ORGANISM="Pelagodinium beii, Strain RCC1491" /NCGR_SAMPLE_ID=MMETSP1338 /ASSEMBLY_ACC=CAM_ASM_000754 /LENGTH=124 /DNA_ID=CAMNT_0043233507 /DNA_START=41 /DNA_END=415 /DNA_ORIENTATION=-